MIVNANIGLLFIDFEPPYMKKVKGMLTQGKMLPGEVIHLVYNIEDGIKVLRENDSIELVVLHIQADKTTVKRALTRLRRVSLAEIMVIALFEDGNDISTLYKCGMNTLLSSVYTPEMTVAYFESYMDRRRLIPGISCLKGTVHIKENGKMQCGDFVIDPARLTIQRNGKMIELTTMEFKLLSFFVRHEGIVFKQEDLFFHVWEVYGVCSSDLTSRIARLRKKIEPDPYNPTYIKTKRGSGYYFSSK